MIACDRAIRKKRKEKKASDTVKKILKTCPAALLNYLQKKLITSGSNYGLKKEVFTGHAYFFFFLREGALVRLLKKM